MKTISTLLISILLSIFLFAQENKPDYKSYPYWINMLKDQQANFFETQNAFYSYMENKNRDEVRGYKQFKRWEWFMKTRVDDKGNRPSPTKIIDNYNAFLHQYGKVENNSDWVNLGPIEIPKAYISSPSGLGRINTIAFHPFNEDELMIGSPSGGLWKTQNHGETWTCLSDEFPTLGVSAIAYDPENPLNIYIGTGDRDANDAPGLGIMRSNDGGNSWHFVNNGIAEMNVNKMMVNPKNPNIVYAAAANGFYISTDYGSTWVRKRDGEFPDFQLNPANQDIIYASRYGSFVYSINGGESWQSSEELIVGNRILIGVTPANPNYVYVMATNQRTFKAFYFSENEGKNFTLMSTTPNIMGRSTNGSDDDGQSWYDACLVADKDDPNTVYAGGIQIWKSTDKGISWSIIAHDTYSLTDNVHVDHHFLDFSPINGNVYVGNDGGIYFTENKGENWSDITGGLAISQIYKLGQSATVKDLVMCGYQDNSTTIYRNGNFSTVIGADGMECLVDYADTSYKYGCIQYGDRKSVV